FTAAHFFEGGLKGLDSNITEQVHPAGDFDKIMRKGTRADTVEGAQSSARAIVNQKDFWFFRRRRRAYVLKSFANGGHEPLGRILGPHLPHLPSQVQYKTQGLLDVSVSERKDLNSEGPQPLIENVLAAVRNDEIRMEFDDLLDVGIDQPADSRPFFHFRRKVIVVTDRNDIAPHAQGKQGLGHARHDGNNAAGRLRSRWARLRSSTGRNNQKKEKHQGNVKEPVPPPRERHVALIILYAPTQIPLREQN